MKNQPYIKKGVLLFGLFLFLAGIPVPGSAAEEFAAPGLIEAWALVTMKAKTSGNIGSIQVEEGDHVKERKVLLEMENHREKALIRLAEARLEKAKAALMEAKVALQNSKKDLGRKEVMKEVIPKKEFENAQDLVLQHEALVSTREGEIKEAEAELHLRTVELENTLIRAPFDGMMTQIHVKKGETVEALNTPICEVVHFDRLYVQVTVPLQFLPRLKKGMRVDIRVEKDAFLFNKKFGGEIWYINPIVDPTSRRFKVKVLLHSPDDLVRPGMIAEVFFPLKK